MGFPEPPMSFSVKMRLEHQQREKAMEHPDGYLEEDVDHKELIRQQIKLRREFLWDELDKLVEQEMELDK